MAMCIFRGISHASNSAGIIITMMPIQTEAPPGGAVTNTTPELETYVDCCSQLPTMQGVKQEPMRHMAIYKMLLRAGSTRCERDSQRAETLELLAVVGRGSWREFVFTDLYAVIVARVSQYMYGDRGKYI